MGKILKLPSVLAFKRGHVMSDARMFNQMSDGRETEIEVTRHGIRGTQNINNDKSREISNIQVNETAKLDHNAIAMIVRFSLAFLPLSDALHACAGTKEEEEKKDARDVYRNIHDFLERAKTSDGLKEVAHRYARNIANGRWLWRNRTIADRISVEVKIGNNGIDKEKKKIAFFDDGLKIPVNKFENYSENEKKLGEEIASQMRGDSSETLTIEAVIVPRINGSEVFPSQNYIEKKPDGFARLLYKVGHPEPVNNTDIRVMGQAAIRDQKVFNAIRTIDTWYSAFEEEGFPIPVEPKGANLQMQEFYRPKKDSAFELFKQLHGIDPNTNQGMFCIACFDRGGVYGEKHKEEKKKTKA